MFEQHHFHISMKSTLVKIQARIWIETICHKQICCEIQIYGTKLHGMKNTILCGERMTYLLFPAMEKPIFDPVMHPTIALDEFEDE